jgi:NAD(P)-dependent dehydrogenase (short-subunit alcohol dehydrogenase family)
MLWHPVPWIRSNLEKSVQKIQINFGWKLRLRMTWPVWTGVSDPLTYNVCRTALKRPVPPDSVAKSILFLASENWSGDITGQILNVDSGKQGKVLWMKDEC